MYKICRYIVAGAALLTLAACGSSGSPGAAGGAVGGGGDTPGGTDMPPAPVTGMLDAMPSQDFHGQQILYTQATVPKQSACSDAEHGFQTDDFEVFVPHDRTEDDVLRYYAQEAERALLELKASMGFTYDEMGLSGDGAKRISLCLQHSEDNEGFGSPSIIILAPVSVLRTRFAANGKPGLARSYRLVKHELVHTLESRLTGGVFRIARENGSISEAEFAPGWYSEGMAAYFSRQEIARNGSTVKEARDGSTDNPVEQLFFKGSSDGSSVNESFYALYGAAIEILVHKTGQGFGNGDESLVLDVYRDMTSSGRTFQQAFIHVFGNKLENDIPGAGFSSYDSFASNYDVMGGMVEQAQEGHEAAVFSANPENVYAVTVFNKGQPLDPFSGPKALESSFLDNGVIKLMLWNVDESLEYDTYFVKFVSKAADGEIYDLYDFYGPVPTYVSNDGLTVSFGAPGGDNKVNLANYPPIRVLTD